MLHATYHVKMLMGFSGTSWIFRICVN